MQKNKTMRFVHSFVALPLMMATLPLNPQSFKTSILPIQQNIVVDQAEALRVEHAAKIDAYFDSIDSPLAGHGRKFVDEAEKNEIEWNLVASIAMRESTGGLHSCKKPVGQNNFWGWNSCKSGFDSIDQGIEVISKNLGGNNPNTAYHYDNKTTQGILQAYNPPSVVKHYADQVMGIMDDIANS